MIVETPTKASELINTISTMADQMQRELDRNTSQKELFTCLREIRRSVTALDFELREGTPDTLSDAC